jgi:hypothetical protein
MVGASCDAEASDGYQGDPCGDEITLYGSATYTEVDRTAKSEGWTIVPGRIKAASVYLCPKHKALSHTRFQL